GAVVSIPQSGKRQSYVLPYRMLALAGGFLVLGFCVGCGGIIGVLLGERWTYHRRYLDEHRILSAAIAGDPAFVSVQIEEFSDGGAYLIGEVPSQSDLERLSALVTKA